MTGCISLGIVLVIGLVVVFSIFGWWSYQTKVENEKRAELALELKEQIEAYYITHQVYPESLKALTGVTEGELWSYLDSPVIKYNTGTENGQPWYHLICVNSGAFTAKDTDHKLSWSGIQCASDPKYLDISAGLEPNLDEHGFCGIDLH